MTLTAERPISVNRAARREIVIDFSPAALKAPFLLRCGALLADYVVMISVPVIGLVLDGLIGKDAAVSGLPGNLAWLVVTLLGLTNFIILPLVSGQTLGKLMTGLRIVDMDGKAIAFRAVLLRHTVGYILTILTLGIGFFIAAFNRNGRTLHDLIAGTVVVYANRKVGG